jgi:hypothetical protein
MSGSGLNLTIVDTVVSAHDDGTLHLSVRPGGGILAYIVFPLTSS